MIYFEKNYTFLQLNFRHRLRTMYVLRLNIIFASKIRDMPYEEVYFQRLNKYSLKEFEEL